MENKAKTYDPPQKNIKCKQKDTATNGGLNSLELRLNSALDFDSIPFDFDSIPFDIDSIPFEFDSIPFDLYSIPIKNDGVWRNSDMHMISHWWINYSIWRFGEWLAASRARNMNIKK